jgi:hypothetical protein
MSASAIRGICHGRSGWDFGRIGFIYSHFRSHKSHMSNVAGLVPAISILEAQRRTIEVAGTSRATTARVR